LNAGYKHALKTLPKAFVRACVFAQAIVRRFWIPVLKAAERSPGAKLFACRSSYRGVFGCYFRIGVRDMRRAQAASAAPFKKK
jgi:hypothetical protein